MSNVTVPSELNVPYAVVETFTALVAVVGNSLVIVLFYKYSVLKTVTNYYVISLACADLLVGLVGIPCALATSVGLPTNFHACILMNSLLLLLCTTSILSLVAVTVDRFWAVIFPLTYHATMTKRRARLIIGVCWLLGAIIGLLPSMGWNKGPPDEPRCYFMEVIDLRYLVFLYFVTIVTPSVFMAVVYVIIYRAVKRQIQKMAAQILPTTEAPLLTRSETKAAESIAVIIVLFVISWIPLYTINTVACFCGPGNCPLPPALMYGTIVLSHLNSAWNPALYAWGMRDFRRCLSRMLHSARPDDRYVTELSPSHTCNGTRISPDVKRPLRMKVVDMREGY